MADVTVDPQVDPQDNLNNWIKQWELANRQYTEDYASLVSMIQQMLALAKAGKVQEAFQDAEMGVMPAATQVQGAKMGQLAGGLNIASALEEFTTDAQNAMNSGSGMTAAQAANFVKFIQQFYAEIKREMDTGPEGKQKWIDQSTGNNLLAAINKICQAFGCSGPDDPNFNAANILSYIKGWIANPTGNSTPPTDEPLCPLIPVLRPPFNNHGYLTPLTPTKPNPNGDTGQQCLQNLQAAFTSWNNTESAQSQGLQAQTQFASNTFNQYMNACTGIFQATQQQIAMMVQNQKSQ